MSLKAKLLPSVISGTDFTIMRSIGCLIVLVAVLSCAPVYRIPDLNEQTIFITEGHSELHDSAPAFVIEEHQINYNLIGTVSASLQTNGEELVSIDSSEATIYAERRAFQTSRAEYQNLIYRIHFKKVPSYHLSAGKNVGLIVIVTLNQNGEPLLVTTVHTCGCYLAIIPTSYLDAEALPKYWDLNSRQNIYGESLPSYLDFENEDLSKVRIMLLIEDGTHRVKNVWVHPSADLSAIPSNKMVLKPVLSLDRLELGDGQTTSFFETKGMRKGLVKGSAKLWERLLISWWSLDWYVGEDKKLGSNLTDGRPFYTSLKPWARNASDMRDFQKFLDYWGWRL